MHEIVVAGNPNLLICLSEIMFCSFVYEANGRVASYSRICQSCKEVEDNYVQMMELSWAEQNADVYEVIYSNANKDNGVYYEYPFPLVLCNIFSRY